MHLARSYGLKAPRGPPTVADFAVLAGGLAGFHASRRQPLPGTMKLWEGLIILNTSVLAMQAFKEGRMENGECGLASDNHRIDCDPGDSD